MLRHPNPDPQPCSLCQRLVPAHLITLHHLKPKERGGKAHHRTPLCKPCHKQLHATYSNKELDRRLDTLDFLRQAQELQPFVRWIQKQNPPQLSDHHVTQASSQTPPAALVIHLAFTRDK